MEVYAKEIRGKKGGDWRDQTKEGKARETVNVPTNYLFDVGLGDEAISLSTYLVVGLP